MELRPDFIGCDAGSVDFGPYYLGSGRRHFSDAAVERDLALILEAASAARIPVLIGSAGTSGVDAHVDHLREAVMRLAGGERKPRVASIYCEPAREILERHFRLGHLRPLGAGADLDDGTLARCSHIVAMAGAEPFIEALDAGADIVLAGRTSDAAIFAAYPILHGAPAGLAWHAGKLLECAAACAEQRKYPDCLFAEIASDSFVVVPPNPDFRCTPVSVAAHNLYESPSPYEVREPSGTLDTSRCTYTPEGGRGVRVAGSAFRAASEYSIKLEGAEEVGYQSHFFGAIRDPILIADLEPWLASLGERLRIRFSEIAGDEADEHWSFRFRRYGMDGAMGIREPNAVACHEVGLVVEVTADNPDLAHGLANIASHIALHHPSPRWTGLITTLALPYSPAVLDRGLVYRFSLNHVIRPADFHELFRIEYEDVS
jgi:hypothetical protein